MLFFRIIIFSLLSIFSLQTHSAEWLAEPAVILKAQYNDNVRNARTNEESAAGYTLEPKLVISGEEKDIWNIKLDTKLRAVRYSGIDNADSDNVFLSIGGSYFTERSQTGFNASYEDNTNFNQDYETQLDISGFTEIQIKRESVYIAPYWYWQMSEKGSITLSLNMSDRTYDENAPSNYNDYASTGGDLSFSWKYSEKTKLGLKIKQLTTENNDLDYENDTKTLQLSYDYNISQNSDISVLLGQSKVEYVYHNIPFCQGQTSLGEALGFCDGTIVYGDNESDSTVNNYSFGYTNKSELNKTIIGLSRGVTASSSGSARQTDKYNINYSRKMTERVKSQLLLSFQKSESLDGLNAYQDSQIYRAEPSIYWRLTKDWGLSFLYRYIKREYLASNTESESNSIYINLSLRWPKAISTY